MTSFPIFAAAECSRTPNGSGPPPSAVPAGSPNPAPPPRSPLYEARLLNVELITENRELREQIAKLEARERVGKLEQADNDIARLRRRLTSAEGRLNHLKQVYDSWIVGDTDESAFVAAFKQTKETW